MKIWQIIMKQINYRRLTVMVGGWNALYSEEKNYFCFRFKASKSYNFCRITYNEGTDLYTVYICKIYGQKCINEKTFDDIYCDQLVSIFETTTGLATHF